MNKCHTQIIHSSVLTHKAMWSHSLILYIFVAPIITTSTDFEYNYCKFPKMADYSTNPKETYFVRAIYTDEAPRPLSCSTIKVWLNGFRYSMEPDNLVLFSVLETESNHAYYHYDWILTHQCKYNKVDNTYKVILMIGSVAKKVTTEKINAEIGFYKNLFKLHLGNDDVKFHLIPDTCKESVALDSHPKEELARNLIPLLMGCSLVTAILTRIYNTFFYSNLIKE